MSTTDETTNRVNGTTPPQAKDAPIKPLHLPPPTDAPRWGTPVDVDGPPDLDEDGGLIAGDETAPEPGGPVDGHIVYVKPTTGQRLAALRSGEVVTPEWVSDPQVRREMAARGVEMGKQAAKVGALNAPKAFALFVWWLLRGSGSVIAAVTRWATDIDGHPLVGEIKATNDRMYALMADKRTKRIKFRFGLLGVLVVLALGVVLALSAWAPWTLPLLVVLVLGLLARHGKPEDVKILTPRTTGHVVPRLTAQNIVRALSTLGIAPLTSALKADSTRLWRSAIVATRGGHKVWVQLPNACVAADLVQHEQRLASALGRPEDTVIVEPMPHVTPGDLTLYVFDKPQLTSDVGPGPLASVKKASWWAPVQIGVTRLGQPHREVLRGGAWFVGGRPSSGKSSLCRVAAAHTALDPNALLVIVNLKGSPDYAALKPVCHRYLAASPESDRTVVPQTIALLRWLLDETARRNDYLVRLVEKGHAESNDVTPELAAKHTALRPLTVILDEVHRLFDEGDNPDAKGTAELLAKVVKACRSVAITLIAATQLAGTESVPPVVTRAARLRGCLTVTDAVSFRQIFGDAGPGAFAAAGVNRFKPGTVLLSAVDGAPLKVGTHNLTPSVMKAIGARALALRTALHTLTGEAAGETVQGVEAVDPADLLKHLLDVIPTTPPANGPEDVAAAWLADLEVVLTERDEYVGRATGWLAGELRARGVPTGQLNRRVPDPDAPGETKQRNVVGVRASDVRTALELLITED